MKKLLLLLLSLLIMFSLAACGKSNSDIKESTSDNNASENQAILKDYYGIYTSETDEKNITIDENGISYDNKVMNVDSIGDGYVIFTDSNAVFNLGDDRVSSNLSHIDDNSYLDIYLKQPEITPTNSEANQSNQNSKDLDNGGNNQQEAIQLSNYAGTYKGETTDDSFVLTDTYQITDIAIKHEIYNYEDVSFNEMSTVFKQDDVQQDENGTCSIDFNTQYGCTGNAIFKPNGDIYLKLELADKVYEGNFIKSN